VHGLPEGGFELSKDKKKVAVLKLAVDVKTGIITAKADDKSNVKVCRGRVDVQLDQIPVGCTLLGRPDPLLVPSHPQVTVRGSAQEQQPQLLPFGGSQFLQHAAYLPSVVDRRLSILR
jgi:hypothetical protein